MLLHKWEKRVSCCTNGREKDECCSINGREKDECCCINRKEKISVAASMRRKKMSVAALMAEKDQPAAGAGDVEVLGEWMVMLENHSNAVGVHPLLPDVSIQHAHWPPKVSELWELLTARG